MFCFVAVYDFVYHLHVILTVKESQHVYALAINHQPQYKMPHASWERQKGQRKARVGQTGRERERLPLALWHFSSPGEMRDIKVFIVFILFIGIHLATLTHTHTHSTTVCVYVCFMICPALIGNLIYGSSWQRVAFADCAFKSGSRAATPPFPSSPFAVLRRLGLTVATCRSLKSLVTHKPPSRSHLHVARGATLCVSQADRAEIDLLEMCVKTAWAAASISISIRRHLVKCSTGSV